MNKFEDVDVIASLEAIMKQNTAFYQNDFDLDRNILQKAAASPTAEDRRLLWFSRPSGTSCFRERDVFLKGTRQHNTWRFYEEVMKWQLTTHLKISGKNEISFRRISQKLSDPAVIPSDALNVVSEMPLSKLQSGWHII